MQPIFAAISRPLAAAAIACACAPATAAPGDAAPGPSIDLGRPDLAAIWNDPGFQKSFVGGYGISPDVEPHISQDDLALLELVRQLMADELPAAQDLLKESITADGCAVLDFTLGGVYFQQDHLDDALTRYRDAVGKFPNFRRAYRSIGLICTRKGKWEDAIAAFNKMIELGGADAYSYGLLGFCHSQRQDYQPAEASYRNALLLQPENVEWRLGLTRSVFKQAKYEDAASLLDVLIAAYPDKAEFWMLQAHTYLGLKQPMKAAVNLEALDALGKATVDNLYTLGDIYVSEQLPDMAASAYGRALAKNPDQPSTRPVRSAEMLAARGGTAQAKAQPMSFAADIIVGSDLTDVIIESFRVRQVAGYRSRYRFALRVKEHVEPPEPASAGSAAVGIGGYSPALTTNTPVGSAGAAAAASPNANAAQASLRPGRGVLPGEVGVCDTVRRCLLAGRQSGVQNSRRRISPDHGDSSRFRRLSSGRPSRLGKSRRPGRRSGAGEVAEWSNARLC